MGTVEENKELIRQMYELFNRNEIDAALELYSKDCFGGDSGWEQVRQVYIMLFKAFPDLKMMMVDMIAEGDKVAVIRKLTGTHTGEPFMGIPAAGKKIDQKCTYVFTIVDNRIVETNGTDDVIGFWQPLGVMPTQEEAIKAYKESHNLQ